METINDITYDFGTLYHPKSALIFYESKERTSDVYVEHFDMDKNGNPINAHPLTVREANALSKSLRTEKDKQNAFLKSNGILPTRILYINPNTEKASVIWYTQAQQKQLFFIESLGLPNGIANVPSLLWKASKNSLSVYALSNKRRPTEKTKLYHAPFLNVYKNGQVCMGTVNIDIKNSASIEEFTQAWEDYFFNSYFSHLMDNYNPIIGNCVNLWKKLIGAEKVFPKETLKPNGQILQNLL